MKIAYFGWLKYKDYVHMGGFNIVFNMWTKEVFLLKHVAN